MKLLLAAIFCLIAILPCYAEPHLHFGALLDTRFIVSDDTSTWLDGGLGKTRYGGEDATARLSQASFLVSASLNDEFSAQLHLNVDAEPEEIQTGSRIDVIEAFASYRPVLSPHL